MDNQVLKLKLSKQDIINTYKVRNELELKWVNDRISEISWIVKDKTLYAVYDSITIHKDGSVRYGNIQGYFVIGAGYEKYYFVKSDTASLAVLKKLGFTKGTNNKRKSCSYEDFAMEYRGSLLINKQVIGIYNIDVKRCIASIKDEVTLMYRVRSFGELVYHGTGLVNNTRVGVSLIVKHN